MLVDSVVVWWTVKLCSVVVPEGGPGSALHQLHLRCSLMLSVCEYLKLCALVDSEHCVVFTSCLW